MDEGREEQPDLPEGQRGEVELARLQQLLESLSLSGMEARTMVGLLRLGSAAMPQLSQVSGISRPNLYPVLDSLAAKGLCQRAPGRYALWVAAGVEEVLAILKEARVDTALRNLAEAQTLMARLPDAKRVESPITVVSEAQSGVAYLEAMAWVDSEILVLNRGPFPLARMHRSGSAHRPCGSEAGHGRGWVPEWVGVPLWGW